MDQQIPTAPAMRVSLSGADGLTSETENKQHAVLVTTVVVTLLTKNGVADIWTREVLITNTKRLVQQTLQGLNLRKTYNPDVKAIKKINKGVIKDLKKTFGGNLKLRSAFLSEQPELEEVIVKHLQAHIRDHSAVVVDDKLTWKWPNSVKCYQLCLELFSPHVKRNCQKTHQS
ncbi:hypothetical protein INR49_027324 [Caranx melampygus]|nr:hypothetical protein INR49_027324 [Caranx melampygus]